MRASFRTAIVLALAIGLVALFLHNVDLRRVAAEIAEARPEWLVLSLATMVVNLAIRALRWQVLLEPMGGTTFGRAFRATAVGFAASSVLPARAGEFIRPYFLARQTRHASADGLSATAAFATVVLERVLDVVTVLCLLASYVFFFGRDLAAADPALFGVVKWSGASAGAIAVAALVAMFVLAGDPGRLGRATARFEQLLPRSAAAVVACMAERFARGLAVIRRPEPLLLALAWSIPLWLSIAAGIWAMSMAFRLAVPFTGSFVLIAMLVLGVIVPTPGAVGGFHEAFRIGATLFFGAPETTAVGAAILLHLFSIGPSLVLGVVFAAQEGLNLTGMRRLAEQAEHGRA
jgi:uncharacterized protein (TIRG00374 family)